jgi:O-methyltransferase involved in polyketide biosynthesis
MSAPWLLTIALLFIGLAVLRRARRRRGADVSVTAHYTNGTWTWGRLPGAELLDNPVARTVFNVTNWTLALAAPFTRAPSLRRSLVQRHVMIDHLVADAGAADVLELAAGLSRRGVTVSADAGVRYTEVDREHVLGRKRRLLARSADGSAALARPNLRLVAADLAAAPLDGLVTAAAGAPLFVIAEGLFMYLDADGQRALWRRIRALFDGRSGTFVFDLVPTAEQPAPGVAGRALEWWFKRFTRGATMTRDTRTRADLAAELTGLGFAVELLEPSSAPARWSLPFTGARTQMLLFVCRVAP